MTQHFGYTPDDISYLGYLIGLALIGVFVVLPLVLMGVRAKNIFRRGNAIEGAGSNWYA